MGCIQAIFFFFDYFQDSYSFIDYARTLAGFNVWPIGYSRFMAAAHWIDASDLMLVSAQYFVLVAALLHFFLTIIYWYPVSTMAKIILFVILFVNPLSLYISNFVSSDALFALLSIFWFSHLLWLVQQHLHIIFIYMLFFCFWHLQFGIMRCIIRWFRLAPLLLAGTH